MKAEIDSADRTMMMALRMRILAADQDIESTIGSSLLCLHIRKCAREGKPLTQDPLDYEPQHAARINGFAAAARNVLLATGIIYCLVSGGGACLFLLALWLGFAEDDIKGLGKIDGTLVETVVLISVFSASGITNVWAAFLVKSRSRRAMRAALLVAIVDGILGLLLLVQLAVFAIKHGVRHVDDFTFAALVCVAIAGVSILVGWLVSSALRNSDTYSLN